MNNVAVTHDNHIIAYGTGDISHLIEDHPGASIRQFTERPSGLRPGNYLNPDGIVERPKDDHLVVHRSIHWEESVEWALREKQNVVTALLLEPRDRTKLVAKVFGALIYNVLLAAVPPCEPARLAEMESVEREHGVVAGVWDEDKLGGSGCPCSSAPSIEQYQCRPIVPD